MLPVNSTPLIKIPLLNVTQKRSFTIPKGYKLSHLSVETITASGSFEVKTISSNILIPDTQLLAPGKIKSIFVNDNNFSMITDVRAELLITGDAEVNAYILLSKII